jgi:predicted lipid-binding transport protein (Tim44 family)
MKHLLSISIAAFLALGLLVQDADAARLGGGRSLGAQRSSVAPSRSTQAAPPSQAAAPAAAPAAAAPKPAGNRWLGPVAGLAAGLGLGWLLGQGGMGGLGGMLGSVMMMLLVGFAVMFIYRLLTRPKTEGNLQYAGAGNQQGTSAAPPSLAATSGAVPAFGGQVQANIPAGFDTEGFLRQAKLNFVKLQAVHDSGKLGELREFTTDAMFASIKQDLLQHGAVGQQTDVVTLNAELLEAMTEGDTHWASVRFSGMIRETADGQAESFQEIWNLAKPASGASGWVLAGIQQIQ